MPTFSHAHAGPESRGVQIGGIDDITFATAQLATNTGDRQ
jgi:hypothetical protein